MLHEDNEIYALNVREMISLLSDAYVTLLRAGKPLRLFPSVMLWGAPGVGKSQGVHAIAKEIGNRTGKTVHVTDVRLLLFNPVDLRGIPTADKDRELAVWLKPKIFQMDESENIVNILFLDEISSAPPSVQAAAYQITLDRTVGEHKLPENCIVIAAGNRVTDRSVVYNMPKALANRLCHFEIKGDADAWHDWAIRNGIHPFITGYLDYNPPMLMRFDASDSSLAFPTPRSWEMLSHIINDISSDIEKIYPLAVGCVGRKAASNFQTWTQLYKDMPSVSLIFSGKQKEIPNAEELRTVLRSMMVSFARENPSQEGLDNSIRYACLLPMEFRKKILHDYAQVPGLLPLLEHNEVWQTAKRNGLQ